MPTHRFLFYRVAVDTLRLFILLCGTTGVKSFVKSRTTRRFGPPSFASSLRAKQEALLFTCDYEFTSEPILGCKREEVVSYFEEPETQRCLISAGGKRNVVRYAQLSDNMTRLWLETCEKIDASGSELLPEDDDIAVSAETIIQFPGLQQTTTVLNGVKKRWGTNGFPEFVYFLIGERNRVSGAAPIVWIYNKLTGFDQYEDDCFALRDTIATSTVSICETENGSFAFTFSFNIQIQVVFPSTLLKILPTSKNRMEQQGTAAVLKAVSGDITDALTATRDHFIRQLGETRA